MVKKTKKGVQIERREVPIGVYSNALGVGYSDTEVVLNFGLSTLSYFEPHDDENVPVARIVLSWETAEGLLETLKDVCEKHKRPTKTKAKSKGKGK